MQKGEETQVTIEKMINEGKGLARIDSMPVFIDNVCSEDTVKIRILKNNKNYLTAELKEIINPSPYRTQPVCNLYNICGSCNWQHIDYKRQLIEKENIVFETIKNITGKEYKIEKIIPSPKTSEYRCKIQYPVSQKKMGRIISGYYKKNSHELINIKYCPMQSPIISEITEYIKDIMGKLNISGYVEKEHKGLVRHIIFRHSKDLADIVIIFVVNSDCISEELKTAAELIMKKYKMVKGVCANFNTKKTNVIMSEDTDVIKGYPYYIETLSNKKYKISANSFFQVNPYCAEKIFDKVKELIVQNIKSPSILDAYSGVSSFGIWLSDIAKKVVCIEQIGSASRDAQDNILLNKCNNMEIINGDAAEKFSELAKKGVKFDVSVVDPPRKGCDSNAINFLDVLTDKFIIYVSCNVSTLARDMKLLSQKSFEAVYIQPIDMFPNTSHIETIVLFKRLNNVNL